MMVRQKTQGRVTATHRSILRKIPLWLLRDAYGQLMLGRSETLVARILEIDPTVFDSALQSAIEEALWERGAL